MINAIGNYNTVLVTASVVLAVLSSYAAIELIIRLATERVKKKRLWLWSGAIVIGMGVWAAHFVGLVDYHGVHQYNFLVVLLSLILTISIMYISLTICIKKFYNQFYIFFGGLALGIGFVVIHFLLLEVVHGAIIYRSFFAGLSIFIALVPTFFALKLVAHEVKHKNKNLPRFKLVSGILMGSTIMGMDYISLIGARYSIEHLDHQYIPTGTLLPLGLTIGCMITLAILVYSSITDRRINFYSFELEKTGQEYQSLFEQNPDIVVKMDLNGFILYSNRTTDEVTGYVEGDRQNQHFDKFIVPEYLETTLLHFQKAVEGNSTNYESAIIHKNNHETIRVNITNIPIVINEEIVGVYGIIKDITQQRKTEEMVKHLAYHDYLTNLPNRYMLEDRLSNQLNTAESQNGKFAILFIDLDRFKVVNDTLGHSIGDLLLKEVATRLRLSVLDKDIVFRQGGDEFIILLDNANRKVANLVANRIITELSLPFKVNNYDIFTSPSIGISLFPNDGEAVETIIKHADFAMYQAKKAGRNTYKFFSCFEDAQSLNPLMLEMELHKAIERNELSLHYQPKVELKTGRIIGTEALIRWNHPKWGIVSPGKFIPIAEESGLIISIGEWALKEACTQNKKWQEQGYLVVSVSVNLSARQFTQSNLVHSVKKVLSETGLEPKYLELEITESMTADIDRTIQTFHQLKQLGVKISIDDFGTGFSSLNYLKRFPVDTLKIDQSFVRELHNNPHDETIVKTIISMAHSLSLNVVAEGIETQEQLIFLQQHLCNEGQGYFFSKPLPAQEFEKIISELEVETLVSKYGISQDVNERMWTQELSRLATNELQETLRLQQGMTLKFKKIDERFIHTLCEGELLYRFGLIPEQVVGKELIHFLPEATTVDTTKYYQRAWDGEKVSYETEINGIYCLTALSPIKRTGEVVEVIGSCIDVSELKKVENALKESEEKYRLIAENMADLIAIFDLSGSILYASPSHGAILGNPPIYYEGKKFIDAIHPEDRSANLLLFEETIKTKRPTYTEYRICKWDDWGLFEVVLTPIFNENGSIQHIVAVSRDITEKRKAEELLWNSEKLSVVGELAAGVAHEIRNPMTSIKGFFQLFQKGIIKQEYFDIVINEFIHVEEIITNFINLSKPQAIHLKNADIKQLLKEVKTLLEPEANLWNIQVSQEFDSDLPTIICDQNQLKQVFVHLFKNSMEALPNGGNIHVKVSTKEKEVCIHIIDNGVGMSGERIQRLGEPFYSNKEKGAGLGLMLCFRIIREHNGTMIFKSKENQGTRVEVKLPLGTINPTF
jgi:diguanylate cyclase (GGDEF)-like protein/PAS domain S-box-containing protein